MEDKIQWIAVCLAVVGFALSLHFFLGLGQANTQLEEVTQAAQLANLQLAEANTQLAPYLAIQAEVDAEQLEVAQKHEVLTLDIGDFNQHLDVAQDLPMQLSTLHADWNAVIGATDVNQQLLDETHEKVLTEVEHLSSLAEDARSYIKAHELKLSQAGVDTKKYLYNLEKGQLDLVNFPTELELTLDDRGLEVF